MNGAIVSIRERVQATWVSDSEGSVHCENAYRVWAASRPPRAVSPSPTRLIVRPFGSMTRRLRGELIPSAVAMRVSMAVSLNSGRFSAFQYWCRPGGVASSMRVWAAV